MPDRETEPIDDTFDSSDLFFSARRVFVGERDRRRQIPERDMAPTQFLEGEVSIHDLVVSVAVEKLGRLCIG